MFRKQIINLFIIFLLLLLLVISIIVIIIKYKTNTVNIYNNINDKNIDINDGLFNIHQSYLSTIKNNDFNYDIKIIKKIKSFVINLTKNKNRLNIFVNNYMKSDIYIISLERLNAINGKEIDIKLFVTDEAYNQISNAEKYGYRLRHYELTRGAVGCFLSHTSLFYKLLSERDDIEYYLIFEDDAIIYPKFIELLYKLLVNSPDDWDIILLGTIREVVSQESTLYNKIDTWWGMHGYIINKRGAKKIIDEINKKNKIDQQIDGMISLMCKNNKLNVYATKVNFVNQLHSGTDIQLPIKIFNDINPFLYKNIELFSDIY